MCHRHLEDAVEEHPAAAGTPTVEAEHELVQVARQVSAVHGPLVSAQEPSLDQGRHAVDGRHERMRVFSPQAGGPLAAPIMEVAEPGQPLVARPAVGHHCSARLDVIGYERMQ
jgi:hypothetical protein